METTDTVRRHPRYQESIEMLEKFRAYLGGRDVFVDESQWGDWELRCPSFGRYYLRIIMHLPRLRGDDFSAICTLDDSLNAQKGKCYIGNFDFITDHITRHLTDGNS